MTDKRSGVERIADERRRQIEVEEYSAEHDDPHDEGELAMAAVCYAAPVRIYEMRQRGNWSVTFSDPWPWNDEDDKRPFGEPSPDDRIRLLEKAGALIAAEIDRLLRKQVAR